MFSFTLRTAVVALAGQAMLAFAAPANANIPVGGLSAGTQTLPVRAESSSSLIHSVEVEANVAPVTAIAARDVLRSLPVILEEVTSKVTPLLNKLTSLSVDSLTVEVVSPITGEIKTILTGAIVEIKTLVGSTLSSILGLVSVEELAKLVAGLVCLIFTALGAVLKIATGATLPVVLPLLSEVGSIVLSLLFTVLSLVDGLLVLLGPLLGGIVGVVANLNLGPVLASIGLKL